MKEKPTHAAFNNLVAAFRDMDHADFLEGVQVSLGYNGDYVAWQDEAENAIEPLEEMAWHGDERAFKSLLYLGAKIAQILERLAALASKSSSENIGDPFEQITSGRQEDASLRNKLTKEDLEILASLTHEKLQNNMKILENAFPDASTLFRPEYLLKISQNTTSGLPVTFYNPENLTIPEFESLEQLTGKLASVRARMDCIRMVLEEMGRAEVWPMALMSVRELRDAQLKQFETLKLGSNLPLSANPSAGRGNALGFTREGATTFAYPVYMELERERTYPFGPGHLDDIRKSYKEYLNQSHEESIEDSSRNEITPASEVQSWNKLNEWRAEAALLGSLSDEESVINSWTQAGMKLIRSKTGYLSAYKLLPESLQNKIIDSTKKPSNKRIETVIRNALKNGLKALAKRIVQADQGCA